MERIHPKTLVVNDPMEVRNAPEKLFVTNFVDLMSPTLITRNTEIPFILESQPGQFGTAEDNQSTIEIVMMEADGDSLDPDDCKEIGRGTVELPAGVQRGSEVEIRFDYAGDGTMTLAAREVSTDSECEVTIVRSGIMDPNQVQEAGNQLALMVAG